MNFRGICFSQGDARVASDFPSGVGIGLRRTTLHERLVARAGDCGVKLLWQSPVVAIGGRYVELVGGPHLGSLDHWRGRPKFARAALERDCYEAVFGGATRLGATSGMQPWSSYVEIHWSAFSQAYVTPVGLNEVCIVIPRGRFGSKRRSIMRSTSFRRSETKSPARK